MPWSEIGRSLSGAGSASTVAVHRCCTVPLAPSRVRACEGIAPVVASVVDRRYTTATCTWVSAAMSLVCQFSTAGSVAGTSEPKATLHSVSHGSCTALNILSTEVRAVSGVAGGRVGGGCQLGTAEDGRARLGRSGAGLLAKRLSVKLCSVT
jgi:hypothetical protein